MSEINPTEVVLGTQGHAPSPWLSIPQSRADTGDCDYSIVAADGQMIAKAFGRTAHATQRNARANAALVSAAPDLLAACKAFLDAPTEEDCCLSEGEVDAVNAMRIAIKKAEGR